MNRNNRYNDELPTQKINKANLQRKQKKTDSQTHAPDRFALFLSSVGNQQVAQLFGGGQVQAKLDLSTSGDKYEQQADNIADQMMQMKPGSTTLKANINRVQTKGGNGGDVPGSTEKGIKDLTGKGSSMSKPVRNFFEPRLGVDLGNVKVHTGSNANALARSVNARAFTYQNEIVFGKGQYQPETTEGKKLIGHELVHTVQQSGGVQRKVDGVVQRSEKENESKSTDEKTKRKFVYKNNPSANPKVLIDAIENPNAVYGYSPNPASKSIGSYANAIDWTNPSEVAKATARREEYHIKNDSIDELIKEMEEGGHSLEEIAKASNQQRNTNRLNDYADDPEGLARVKQRNLSKYKNENGPTAEFLLKKYGSWEKVIEKSMSANPGMDACCGLYDKYFHLYDLK